MAAALEVCQFRANQTGRLLKSPELILITIMTLVKSNRAGKLPNSASNFWIAGIPASK
jgi:hypothetical protein